MDSYQNFLKVACVTSVGMNLGMQSWFVFIHAPTLRKNVDYKILSRVQGMLFPKMFATSAVLSSVSLAGYYLLIRRGHGEHVMSQIVALTLNFGAALTNVALTGPILRTLSMRDEREATLAETGEAHKQARLRLIKVDKQYAHLDRRFYRIHGLQTALAALGLVALSYHLVHISKKVDL